MSGAHFAIIPAAGTGSRFGSVLPKQYEPILARPMLEHAVHALGDEARIDNIFVALRPGDEFYSRCSWPGRFRVDPLYCGGPSRACTVFNALMAIRDSVDDDDWVWVHDAARPCLCHADIERLLSALEREDVGALLALPLTDTVKRADAVGRVEATAPREGLWRALTPQAFRYRLLVEALHDAAGVDITDEASAIERLGLRPRLVQGASTNVKVTYPDDLQFAAAILGQRATR